MDVIRSAYCSRIHPLPFNRDSWRGVAIARILIPNIANNRPFLCGYHNYEQGLTFLTLRYNKFIEKSASKSLAYIFKGVRHEWHNSRW